MAEQSSTALKELDEHLTCSVCLDQYTNPKTLQCHHSFCLKCIEKLPQEPQGDKYFISCPSCRKPTQLPNIGATDLPAAFLINSLLQLQNKLMKASCEEVNMECEIHHDPLKVYCDTCKKLICRDCTISPHHQNHKYKLVDECYPDHQQKIEAHLTKVKTKVADINVAVTILINREREITKQGEDVKKEIHTQAQLIVNLVQQSERQLVQQVDTAVQQKSQLLIKQREEAEAILNQLKGCEEFVEHSLKVGSQEQVLREKQNMVQVMTSVSQSVHPDVFQPIEEANITFTGNQTLVKSFAIGELKSKPFGQLVLVKNDCYLGKKSTITLNLHSNDGCPISVPLSLISCELFSYYNQPIACDINMSQSGNYNISFTPLTIGKYQLKVKLGKVDTLGSPFTLTPEMIGKPVNIISELNRPSGVVVTNNEEIIVAENNSHCIRILNKDGRTVKSLGRKGTGKVQFINPRGVSISHDGFILVTDDHRLQKLTFEGDCVKSVGILQFHGPTGIAVHPTTGQIFIADRNNHRIQVLNNDLSYCNSFGMYGSAPEQFHNPHDLIFDNKGVLYVVDYYNHCIKKFTSTGRYISKFGSYGSSPGQLDYPTSIAIYNTLVYVSEYENDRISIFDTNGCFIHCFGKRGKGEGEFDIPVSITVDSLGNLYVSDTHNYRLVVL